MGVDRMAQQHHLSKQVLDQFCFAFRGTAGLYSAWPSTPWCDNRAGGVGDEGDGDDEDDG